MTQVLFLEVYGLLVILSLFLTLFWTRLSWRRAWALREEGKHRPSHFWCDRYMVISSALGLGAAGSFALFGSRLLDALRYGTSMVIPFSGWLVASALSGLYIIVLAKFGFAWAIRLDKHDRKWLILLLLCTSWTLFAFWWVYV